MKTKNNIAAKVSSLASLCYPTVCLVNIPQSWMGYKSSKGGGVAMISNIKVIPCHVEILRGAAFE